MEEVEKPETTSWLNFLTKGEPEDLEEPDGRYLFHISV